MLWFLEFSAARHIDPNRSWGGRKSGARGGRKGSGERERRERRGEEEKIRGKKEKGEGFSFFGGSNVELRANEQLQATSVLRDQHVSSTKSGAPGSHSGISPGAEGLWLARCVRGVGALQRPPSGRVRFLQSRLSAKGARRRRERSSAGASGGFLPAGSGKADAVWSSTRQTATTSHNFILESRPAAAPGRAATDGEAR